MTKIIDQQIKEWSKRIDILYLICVRQKEHSSKNEVIHI